MDSQAFLCRFVLVLAKLICRFRFLSAKQGKRERRVRAMSKGAKKKEPGTERCERERKL